MNVLQQKDENTLKHVKLADQLSSVLCFRKPPIVDGVSI